MEERIKKSALQAEGIFDYQKLMYPDTGLIAVKIEEEGEELLLTYNLEALTPMTEIRKEDITTRLAVLENIELLAACRKSYYFTLEPENLYYDRNHLVYVKQRDICGEDREYDEQKWMEEYKALIGYALQKQYSYADYVQGGMQLLKGGILQKVRQVEFVEELVRLLEQRKQEIETERSVKMIFLNRRRYRTLQASFVVALLLAIVLAVYALVDFIRTEPYKDAVIAAENAYISADYVLYGSEQRFLDLARENNCYSVEDLISLTKLYPKYNWDVVNKRIDELKLIVERNNIKGIELETYEYENNGIELVDKLNRGDVLLLDNPTLELQTKFRGLRTYSIDEIKHNLKLTDQFGRNVIGRIRNIGPDSITKIISALKMYDEQILRQANLTEKRNYNLFLKDKKAKNEIVEDLYSDIIMYLIYNTEERTIWGELTEPQKKLYISSVINSKKRDTIIKDRMIDIISNYTTLPELEKVADGNRKVLKRFIEK